MKFSPQSHWDEIAEVGTLWGLRLLVLLVKVFGVHVVRVVLYPIVLYYFLVNRTARAASMDYLARVAAFDPSGQVRPTFICSYRHFMSFAESLVARVAAWTGRITLDDLTYSGREHLLGLLDRRQGAILVGAHLGNLDVCRALSKERAGMRLNIVVSTVHAEKFNRIMRSLSGNVPIELIEVTRFDPATAVRLQKKIADGEFVVITGDRLPVTSDRSVDVTFLGHPARFPQGPFILAALLKCPVYTFMCIKEGAKYAIYCEPLADRIRLERGQAAESLKEPIQRYASQVEAHCRKAPLQWFNFYSFWGAPS